MSYKGDEAAMDEKIRHLVDGWIELGPFGNGELENIPTIYDLWVAAQEYMKEGSSKKAYQCELLIRVLHNSFVSTQTRLGTDVDFAYGGIGIVIHKDAEIGSNVMIGQGVTIGGAPGISRIESRTGNPVYYPKINDFVYISAGARIIGGIEIGKFSIIGANAVVKRNIPPFSVCFGVPVKEPRPIDKKNFLKYKGYWAKTKFMDSKCYIDFVTAEYERLLPDTTYNRGELSAELPPFVTGFVAEVWQALEHDSKVAETLQNSLKVIAQDFAAVNSQVVDDDGCITVKLPFTGDHFLIVQEGVLNFV